MKYTRLSLIFGFFLVLILASCKDKKIKSLQELLPAMLFGNKPSSQTEPAVSAESNYNYTDTVISLGNFNQNAGNCSPDAGQSAKVCLVSVDNVDRYKSIEIVFSSGMQKKSVVESFSLISLDSGAIPTPTGDDLDNVGVPDKGGRFTWLSGRRLIFDPYRELKSNERYSLTIANTAKTATGDFISEYNLIFKVEHEFVITNLINGAAVGPTIVNDMTFNKSANLILNSNFVNIAGAFTNVQKITLNRLGTGTNYEICNGSCSALATAFNLNASSVPPVEGGNTYFYEIQTRDNKTYKRYFSFNYGNVVVATGLIAQNAYGVLDEAIMMKLFSQVLERFSKTDFKVKDAGVNKALSEFTNAPTTNTKRAANCINYGGSFTFIRSYGDSGTANGDGYCGPAGENPGAFVGNACFAGCSDFDMDVYITSANLIPTVSGIRNLDAALKANSTGEMGVELSGKKVDIGLTIIARNRSGIACLPFCLIGGGNAFHFTTTARLNFSPPSEISRLAVARTLFSINGAGNLGLDIKPFTIGAVNDINFDIAPWDANIDVDSLSLVSSTNWVASILGPITTMIGNSMVPQVRPKIVHSLLGDLIEKIAPNVLNAIIGSLNNPGLTITLPNYLPAPLANFPLNVKLKLQTDAEVRVSGANKGLVASVDLGITATTGSPRIQSREQGIVFYKPLGAMNNPYGFSLSSANPGMLLALHSDAITQAAYHLWRARALDLNIDEAFINSINAYSGANPLFQLATSLMRTGPIMSIIAPGSSSLHGVQALSPFNRLPPISNDDPITFVLEPIHVPVIKFIPPTTTAVPKLRGNFSDLQLTIVGKRTSVAGFVCNPLNPISGRDTANNCFYTLSSVRVSVDTIGSFGFKTFSNPTANPAMNNLNALFVELDPNNDFNYTVEVREISSVNPYGIDPAAIISVINPLVKSFVVPLVNSILKEVPLPAKLDFPGLVDKAAGPSGGTACKMNVQTTALDLGVLATPPTEQYLLAKVRPIGSFATNPGTLLECP
jgi:hypothetical protein